MAEPKMLTEMPEQMRDFLSQFISGLGYTFNGKCMLLVKGENGQLVMGDMSPVEASALIDLAIARQATAQGGLN